MDLSIVTNFLNFLLTYNIIFFLKLSFKIIFGRQVSQYAELTPIGTVVSLYNDLFRLLYTISGAVAHGFSFREHRLSAADRFFNAAKHEVFYTWYKVDSLDALRWWRYYAERRKSNPYIVEPKMTSEEKKDFEQFLEFVTKLTFSPENDSDVWKSCLLSKISGDVSPNKFFRELESHSSVARMRLTEELIVSMEATLKIAEMLKAQDLEEVYVLHVEGDEQKVGVELYFLGSQLFGEPNKYFRSGKRVSVGFAKIQNIADSVAQDHNLESHKLHDAVLKAAEAYAYTKRDPVEVAYKATGVLYNSPSSPVFKEVRIKTCSPTEHKDRPIMVAIRRRDSWKTSTLFFCYLALRHYFAIILFGAGQVIGITILGANVWNPFDSSNAHSLRDILRNNIKYTIVLAVLAASNLLVLLIEKGIPVFYKHFEETDWRSHSRPQFTKHYFLYVGMSACETAIDILEKLELPTDAIYFTDDSYYVPNVQLPSTMSIYTGASDKMLTFSRENQLHEVIADLNIVYFFVNFIALPLAMLRYSRLYTWLFGRAYTGF